MLKQLAVVVNKELFKIDDAEKLRAYQKIYSMDSVGGAIEIQYSEEVFVTCDEIPKTDILPENE